MHRVNSLGMLLGAEKLGRSQTQMKQRCRYLPEKRYMAISSTSCHLMLFRQVARRDKHGLFMQLLRQPNTMALQPTLEAEIGLLNPVPSS